MSQYNSRCARLNSQRPKIALIYNTFKKLLPFITEETTSRILTTIQKAIILNEMSIF